MIKKRKQKKHNRKCPEIQFKELEEKHRNIAT